MPLWQRSLFLWTDSQPTINDYWRAFPVFPSKISLSLLSPAMNIFLRYPNRNPFVSLACTVIGVLVAGLVLGGCGGGGEQTDAAASVCDPDDGGLTLADGFCATVVADSLGSPRHLAVSDNGDVYAALREIKNGGGVVALRDTDGDFKADRNEFFGERVGEPVLVSTTATCTLRRTRRFGATKRPPRSSFRLAKRR